jgi:hypothetical protein
VAVSIEPALRAAGLGAGYDCGVGRHVWEGGGLTSESPAENDQLLDELAHASSVAAGRVSGRSSMRSPAPS